MSFCWWPESLPAIAATKENGKESEQQRARGCLRALFEHLDAAIMLGLLGHRTTPLPLAG